MLILHLIIFLFTTLSSCSTPNQEIIWTQDRKLSWSDFKGKSKPVEGSDVAAVTRCGISMQTNSVTGHQKPVFYVQAVFYKDQSWYRKDMPMTAAILNHEQKHFDLCEVYARQLRKKFHVANLNAQNLTKEANRIFNDVNSQYLERQTLYDKETRHGQEASEQAKWNDLIAKELVALEEFSK
jgi:hypothetical protein